MLFFSLKINISTGHNDISYDVVSKCFGELCPPLNHKFTYHSKME